MAIISTAIECNNDKTSIQTALDANHQLGQRIEMVHKGSDTVNIVFYKIS